MDIKQIFGNNVKKLRMAKGISQEELAEKCQLHRTYIGSIERGERNISIVNVAKIAKGLDVDIKDLF